MPVRTRTEGQSKGQRYPLRNFPSNMQVSESEHKRVALARHFDNPLAEESMESMVKEFGFPDDLTKNSCIWYDIDSEGIHWKKIEIKNEGIPHGFPADHTDFMYGTADIDIPPEVHKEVAGVERFGSAHYDPLKKEVTVRCAFLTKNNSTFKKLMEEVERHRELEERLKTMDKQQADAPLTNKVAGSEKCPICDKVGSCSCGKKGGFPLPNPPKGTIV